MNTKKAMNTKKVLNTNKAIKLIALANTIFVSALVVPQAFCEDSEKTSSQEQPDKVVLESTFVGDKEQPAVSYFIPWQSMGTPEKLYRNIEGTNDHSLDAVDREVLIRTINIYNELNLENSSQ